MSDVDDDFMCEDEEDYGLVSKCSQNIQFCVIFQFRHFFPFIFYCLITFLFWFFCSDFFWFWIWPTTRLSLSNCFSIPGILGGQQFWARCWFRESILQFQRIKGGTESCSPELPKSLGSRNREGRMGIQGAETDD